jgi:hypothetical protein
MESMYFYSAVAGGTLMAGQFLLGLLGIGDDVDLDDVGGDVDVDTDGMDHGGEWFVGILSFRAVVAAITVFGLAGLSAGSCGLFTDITTLAIAVVSGGVMLYGVGTMLKTLYRMKSDGTVQIEQAIGNYGTVYLTVPSKKAGAGKVSIKVQERMMEYEAMTAGEELPSGTPVVVVDVISPGVVDVKRATESTDEGDADV